MEIETEQTPTPDAAEQLNAIRQGEVLTQVHSHHLPLWVTPITGLVAFIPIAIDRFDRTTGAFVLIAVLATLLAAQVWTLRRTPLRMSGPSTMKNFGLTRMLFVAAMIGGMNLVGALTDSVNLWLLGSVSYLLFCAAYLVYRHRINTISSRLQAAG